jgi:hypothetical protein
MFFAVQPVFLSKMPARGKCMKILFCEEGQALSDGVFKDCARE